MPSYPKSECGKTDLLNERLFRFIQVLLEVLHEGCPACSHGSGVAGVSLMLAENIAVGVADVDFAKLYEEIDTGRINSPEIGVAEFTITDVATEQRTAEIIVGLF